MIDREARRQRLQIMGAEFYRCPNSAVILMTVADWDDKVLCGCGQPNPACRESESGKYLIGSGYVHFIGAHIKRCLPRATLESYLDQGPEGLAFERLRRT